MSAKDNTTIKQTLIGKLATNAMKYLALLSGGKDSCHNLIHCAKNGHELVAAASLGPEAGKEELDSYLYQTVGQDAIEFVARALDVPLYRRIITGNAVNQGSEYGGRNATSVGGVVGDETEDLYELLVTVKIHHPDVQGVSVGAILSNYQRVRVEHVCRRLNLTPLCFLWQRDQGELLSEMIDSGLEAILIKVAGIGLTTTHLGKTLSEMKTTLFKLNGLYGSHICGEGGEYESLTLDCPLFKHRINLTETEKVIHSDNDFATVAFLRIKSATLEEKPKVSQFIDIPSLLDEDYEKLRLVVSESEKDYRPEVQQSVSPVASDALQPILPISKSQRKGAWISVSNIQIIPSEIPVTIEEEVAECFHTLTKSLGEYGLQLPQVSIINICISSMELFARINAVYSTFFGVSPPARACVAVDLPEDIHVRLECIAFAEATPLDRQALHVQGLSYWAPANIGPYSQAIIVSERAFVSGQIGLIPSQLTLPSSRSLSMEVALASQHISRITSALQENTGGGWAGYTQSAIYWLTNVDDLASVKLGHRSVNTDSQVPVLFLVVKELPKDALVEKQVILHTGRCEVIDEYDGESMMQNCRPRYNQGSNVFENGSILRWEISQFAEDGSACGNVYLKGDFTNLVPQFTEAVSSLLPILSSTLSIRYFHCPLRVDLTFMEELGKSLFGDELPPITAIPCRVISSMDKEDWEIALCFITASGISS